jgi:hypothetical protein
MGVAGLALANHGRLYTPRTVWRGSTGLSDPRCWRLLPAAASRGLARLHRNLEIHDNSLLRSRFWGCDIAPHELATGPSLALEEASLLIQLQPAATARPGTVAVGMGTWRNGARLQSSSGAVNPLLHDGALTAKLLHSLTTAPIPVPRWRRESFEKTRRSRHGGVAQRLGNTTGCRWLGHDGYRNGELGVRKSKHNRGKTTRRAIS